MLTQAEAPKGSLGKCLITWSRRPDSNRGPADYESAARSPESGFVETKGLSRGELAASLKVLPEATDKPPTRNQSPDFFDFGIGRGPARE